MECTNCGAPIGEGRDACDGCGLPVAGLAAMSAADAGISRAASDPDVTEVHPQSASRGGAGSGGSGAGTGGSQHWDSGDSKPFWKRIWFWVVVAVVIIAAIVLAVLLTRGATVPAVVGLPTADAKAATEKVGMVYVVRGIQFTTAVKPGVVTVQYPAAGSSAKKNDQLSVLLATDAHVSIVPNVVGQLPSPAVNALEAAGFIISGVTGAQSTEPRGTVLAQDPGAGTQAPIGSGVALTLSQGPATATVAVPNLVGMQQNVADEMLTALGLTGSSSTAASSAPKGEVIAQTPAAGTSVASGAGVTMVNSDGSGATTSTAPPTPTTVTPTTATPTTVPPTTATTAPAGTTTTESVATTSTTVVNEIAIVNLAFEPASLTVNAGDTVTWVNQDTTAHDIVADDGSFDSGNLAPSASFHFTFPTTGTVPYHCSIHPQMTGTVVVQ